MTKSRGIIQRWKPEEEQYLINNIKELTDQEIADNLGFSKNRVLIKLYKLKLRPAEFKHFSFDEIQVIIDNYKTLSYSEIGQLIGRSRWSIKYKTKCLGLKRTPEEARKIQDRCCYKSNFKKGGLPPTTLYDGCITERKDNRGRSYKFIRLSKGVWKHLQIYNWEIKYGDIPKQMVLACVNGDTLNCDCNNWELITKEENLLRNSGQRDLTDKYIIDIIARRDKSLKEEIRNHPAMIELKRNELLLKRAINEYN